MERARRLPHRISRAARRLLFGLSALAVALPLAVVASGPSPASAADARFGAPDATAAEYYGALLRHTRWVNTVWDASLGAYQLKDFNFTVVLGNAVLLTQGEYDEALAGIPKAELRDKTIATLKYYAASNRNVNPNGNWGRKLFWDSTFQSYFLAAGRLMWDELDQTTRSNLTAIATAQSTYTADLAYGDDPLSGSWTADWPTGKYLGDTAQEEVGVYTQALAPGLAWAPDNPDAARWSEQLGAWGRNAAGQPTADRNNPAIVAGAPISDNTMQTIQDTYLVENHGSFSPHYQSDIWRSGARNAIQFILNDQPLPEIITRQPNSAQLWESLKLVMSDQGEPFMPMDSDREFLYGRDVIPLAFLAQVQRDPDAARAEANLAAGLEAYQAYAPVDRLTKFSGEPKYEPEARAEIAISYLLHVASAKSPGGPVEPTPQNEFFARLSGVRDFGSGPGLTVQQTSAAWAAASSRAGFVKFPWVPTQNSWMFKLSGTNPFMYPTTSPQVGTRSSTVYTAPRDGFDGSASMFQLGEGYAGLVTLPTGSAVYASSGAGRDDAGFTVRNLDLGGYAGLDGTRTYAAAEGEVTAALPVVRPADPVDVRAARVDDLNFDPVTARYVRIQGQQGNPTYGYSMYSLHAYGADPASSADLAAGKSVTASSQDAPSRTAARVTDSDPASRWAVAPSQRAKSDSWIQVDLGAEQTVGSVRLAWESSAGVRYLVQTSLDGQNWSTQAGFDASVARADAVDLVDPATGVQGAVETRFIRMQGVQGQREYGYSLYSLRALDASGVDVAAGRPATASSTETGRSADAITDGDASTRWAVSREERVRPDSWVQVDLGEPIPVAQVQLGWESAAGRAYRIQTSLDGQTWQDAASFQFTGDQILSSSGAWLNVEDAAGFVVRGTDAPITVSQEGAAEHMVRLADGGSGPVLVEMMPGGAERTSAQAQTTAPTVAAPGVLASSLDGYLAVFNVTGQPVTTTVTVPYVGGAASLFSGMQRLGADSSELEVAIPAGTAVTLAPRATVALPVPGAAVTVVDARTIDVTADAPFEVVNVETGDRAEVPPSTTPSRIRFGRATAYPVPDLALSTLTFPASVLPEGMSSPAFAVDGDASTAWVPGPAGRMVVDLGSSRDIGSIVATWDGAGAPTSTFAVSDDGLVFRGLPAPSSDMTAAADPVATARYVAITTDWSEGDPALESLRVLPPGVVDEVAPGPIEGQLPAWSIGQPATGSLSATGTPAPRFAIVEGALPEGVTLDAATGSFGGVPTEAGTFSFTVSAMNGIGDASTRAFEGTVAGRSGQGPVDPPPAGQGGSGDLAATGLTIGGLAAALMLLAAGAVLLVRRRRALADR